MRQGGKQKVAFAHHRTDACASLLKEEVVGIILQLTSLLWEEHGKTDGQEHAERILAVADRGAAAALQRSNGIFYIQMMIARVIAARRVADHSTAFYLLGLAGDVLAKSGLTLNHEGLKGLHAYLCRSDPDLARLLSFMSSCGAADSASFFAVQAHTSSHSEMADARHSLRQATVTAEQITSVADLLHLTP